MTHDFDLKKPKPQARRGGQAGNTNNHAPSQSVEEMAAMSTVLAARCKKMGWAATEQNMRTVKADHFVCEAGIALHKAGFDADLWDLCKSIHKTFHTIAKLRGVPRSPQNSCIQYVPEQVTVNPDDPEPVKLTEEEENARFRNLANQQMRMITWIAAGAGPMAEHFKDVVIDDAEPKAGFMAALRGVYAEFEAAKKKR